jgi:hypothetical protein
MSAIKNASLMLDGEFDSDTFNPLKEMFESIYTLNEFFGLTGTSRLSFDGIASGIESVATRMDSAIDSVSTMADNFQDNAVTPLTEMINAIKTLNEETGNTLGDINISRVLQAFGDALAVHDGNITVEREQIRVNINLNVTMRTRDVAEQLVEGEWFNATERGLRLLDD